MDLPIIVTGVRIVGVLVWVFEGRGVSKRR